MYAIEDVLEVIEEETEGSGSGSGLSETLLWEGIDSWLGDWRYPCGMNS